jgi:hypothetical protein
MVLLGIVSFEGFVSPFGLVVSVWSGLFEQFSFFEDKNKEICQQ